MQIYLIHVNTTKLKNVLISAILATEKKFLYWFKLRDPILQTATSTFFYELFSIYISFVQK